MRRHRQRSRRAQQRRCLVDIMEPSALPTASLGARQSHSPQRAGGVVSRRCQTPVSRCCCRRPRGRVADVRHDAAQRPRMPPRALRAAVRVPCSFERIAWIAVPGVVPLRGRGGGVTAVGSGGLRLGPWGGASVSAALWSARATATNSAHYGEGRRRLSCRGALITLRLLPMPINIGKFFPIDTSDHIDSDQCCRWRQRS